jgi:hypothetical protein
MGALAVDLGMAFAARAAAQRAADSAALAGASAFQDFPEGFAEGPAEDRAYEFALANDVIHRAIDSSHVEVWVIPDSQRVRVRISAGDLPTWFGKILGVMSMDVAAIAAAEASSGGSSDQCVLPFAIVDLWDEGEEDENDNSVPDDGEEWFLQDSEEGVDDHDPYFPFADSEISDGYPFPYSSTGGTGLGSAFRDGAKEPYPVTGDFGRRLVLKSSPGNGGPAPGGSPGGGWHPNHSGTDGPGNFQVWQMPDIDAGEACAPGTGSGGTKWTQQQIAGCNPCAIQLGTPYPVTPGNKAAIDKPLKDLYDLDPGAEWSESLDRVVGSRFGTNGDGGMRGAGSVSPLVRVAAIASPLQDFTGKVAPIEFNNFAYVFLEPYPPKATVYVRFLGPITGGGGPVTGPLVKYLRLVQ